MEYIEQRHLFAKTMLMYMLSLLALSMAANNIIVFVRSIVMRAQ